MKEINVDGIVIAVIVCCLFAGLVYFISDSGAVQIFMQIPLKDITVGHAVGLIMFYCILRR